MATTRRAKTEELPDEVSNASGEKPLAVRVKKGARTVARVTLFEYEDEQGNVTEFKVPEKPGVNATLKFLDELRRTGNEMFAAMGLLESLLGKEKYTELLEIEDLEDEDLSDILEAVVTLAMNRLEETSGK
jgi:hypothetical protein